MFKIIGADQKEYGPVPAEELKRWIAEGRANGQTLVQQDGAAWRPLASFPEFAADLPPAPATPLPAAPTPFPVGTSPLPAQQQVSGPAVGLIVTGVLGILGAVAGLLMHLAGVGPSPADFNGPPELQRLMTWMSGTAGAVANLVSLAVSGVILYGGLKLQKLENYALCVVAIVLAMLPCVSPCCCIGLPVGIWAFVILNRPEVRSQFR
jgi:hypothetical protein